MLACTGAARADAGGDPQKMVADTIQSLASLIADCRLALATDPVALRGVIEQELRPKADVLYATQLILARHWSEAEPAQRRRFAEALYGSLLNRYAMGLLMLTERNVSVAPGSSTPREGEAQVELRIDAGLAQPVPVFLQLRRSNGQWKVYDARWEDQSYVLSLRHAYSQEIRRKGLENVIRELEADTPAPPGLPQKRQTTAGRCLRERQVQ